MCSIHRSVRSLIRLVCILGGAGLGLGHAMERMMRQEIRKLAVAAILLGGVATFGVSAPAWSEDAPAQASATGSEQPLWVSCGNDPENRPEPLRKA